MLKNNPKVTNYIAYVYLVVVLYGSKCVELELIEVSRVLEAVLPV